MRFILPALFAAAQGLYASQGPAESAAEFVKKLGAGPVDLSPSSDTAIVAEISAGKKESILQRLQRLALEIKGDEVQIGPIRIEGELAGVILRTVDPANPSDVRVLPMAMVQGDGTWRAAPVPASFENTIASHSRASRDIARQLEAWLAREQVNEVERLRNAADGLLRESLAKAIAPEIVRTWNDEQAATEFLATCGKRDIPRILALLGGLSTPPQDGWQQAAAAARSAIATPAPEADSWTLLTSPAILRSSPVRVGSDDDGTIEYRVLCLDPRKGEDLSLYAQILHISKGSDGLWSIRPATEPDLLGDDELQEIQKKASALFSSGHPLRPQASAVELKNALLTSLRSNESPYSCLGFLHRENQPESDYPRFLQAVRMRWETINPATPVIPLELGFLDDSDNAYLAMQWLSLGRLTFSTKVFHLQKNKDGWVWNASPDKAQATAAELWVKLNEAAWKKSSLQQAVRGCGQIDRSLPAPVEAEANQLVQNWLTALAASDWSKALSLCAQLGTGKSPAELLRNLGYECKTSRMSTSTPRHEWIAQGKTVSLIGTRSAEQSHPLLTLLPVVATPDGPRILLEIDLGDPARPGRAFLNRNALDRLQAVHPDVADELRTMLSKLNNGK